MRYEVREVFIHPLFEPVPPKVLGTFRSYLFAALYRWWMQFGWEASTHATWRLDIVPVGCGLWGAQHIVEYQSRTNPGGLWLVWQLFTSHTAAEACLAKHANDPAWQWRIRCE